MRLIDGCDHAGISVVQGRELSTPVAFDDVARCGDTLQYQLHEGPCLDVVRWHETVISPNLSEEARWPEWTPRAVSVLGIKAMMSLWLDAGINSDGADSYGALNLYSDSIDPFGPNEYAIAQVMAAQTSVALAAHREIMNIPSLINSGVPGRKRARFPRPIDRCGRGRETGGVLAV